MVLSNQERYELELLKTLQDKWLNRLGAVNGAGPQHIIIDKDKYEQIYCTGLSCEVFTGFVKTYSLQEDGSVEVSESMIY